MRLIADIQWNLSIVVTVIGSHLFTTAPGPSYTNSMTYVKHHQAITTNIVLVLWWSLGTGFTALNCPKWRTSSLMTRPKGWVWDSSVEKKIVTNLYYYYTFKIWRLSLAGRTLAMIAAPSGEIRLLLYSSKHKQTKGSVSQSDMLHLYWIYSVLGC